MFYDYQDSHKLAQSVLGVRCTRDELYKALDHLSYDTVGYAHLQWEKQWSSARRPFYRVYPSIIPMLCRLDISAVPSSACRLPLDTLLIQLPKDNALGDGRDIEYIMAGKVQTRVGDGTMVGIIDGSTGPYGVKPVSMWLFEHSTDPISVVLDRLKRVSDISVSTAVRDRVCSLVTTLCLLDQVPELISPVLLKADEGRTIDLDRAIERAHKRGRIGWNVGAGIEVIPHYRRPHPALVWTGSGRTVPKIVLRKGSLVHRSKVEALPTGYQDDKG